MVVQVVLEDLPVRVLVIEEVQEVLQAFLEELQALPALVLALAFSLLEEVDWNQSQEILVEVLTQWELLGGGILASEEYLDLLVHQAEELLEVAKAREDDQASQEDRQEVEDRIEDAFPPWEALVAFHPSHVEDPFQAFQEFQEEAGSSLAFLLHHCEEGTLGLVEEWNPCEPPRAWTSSSLAWSPRRTCRPPPAPSC